jgi:hypothetical protein
MNHKREEQRIRNEFFPNHTATLQTASFDRSEYTIKKLVWSNGNSNMYRIVYLLHGCLLTVFGDCEEAIYIAGLATFEEWASCELDYFAGKCQASRHGQGGKSWDGDYAKTRLTSMINEYAKDENAEPLTLDQAFNEIHQDTSVLNSRIEWHNMIRHCDEGLPYRKRVPHYREVIDLTSLYDIGITPDICIHAHLVGLKMAVDQLKARGELS